MDNRHPWAITIESALGRISDRYSVVEASLLGVQADYRLIAETIKDAMRADPKLNQKLIAGHIGKSTSWVSRTLVWHTKGCKSESPFGEEIAARRKAAKLERTIATSQSGEAETAGNEEDLGQLCLLGGHSDYVPGRAEATLRAMALMRACQTLKALAGLDRETLMLVRPSADDKRLFTLKILATELTRSIAASTHALDEVRAALKEAPQMLEAAE